MSHDPYGQIALGWLRSVNVGRTNRSDRSAAACRLPVGLLESSHCRRGRSCLAGRQVRLLGATAHRAKKHPDRRDQPIPFHTVLRPSAQRTDSPSPCVGAQPGN